VSTWQRRSGIMLCYPFEERRLEKWPRPFLMQPKLDGERCRALIDEHGTCTLLSSEENIITSVPHINQALEDMDLRNIELDGELYCHGMDFSAIHSIVSRKANMHPDFESIDYWVFDIIDHQMQAQRAVALASLENDFKHPVYRVPTLVGNTLDDAMDRLRANMDEGYEGIILRHFYYPYDRKRSTGIMKFKPRESDSYMIVGYEQEISIQGEPKQALGALWLSSDEGTRFKVGTGPFLTRHMREYMWENRDELINCIAEIKYQNLTAGRKVPRNPVLFNIHRPLPL
jgi:bifunctional non-homologous end joining protein LigD